MALPRWQHERHALLVALTFSLVGCQEQFLLRVRDPDKVHVAEEHFGETFEYHGQPDHQNSWVDASPHTAVTPAEVQVEFRYGASSRSHARTRVTLSTPLSNLCELRVRQIPDRVFGVMSLALGVGTGAAAFSVAEGEHRRSDAAIPALATSAGIFALTGALLLLWPRGTGTLSASHPQAPGACPPPP